MATFPTYAEIVLDGYQEKPDYGVLRTEMDNSLPKQRSRRSLPIVKRDVRIKVADRTKKAAFDDWFANDLNGGTGWFDFYDNVANVTKQGRIVGGAISWSTPGFVWIAQCSIETVG